MSMGLLFPLKHILQIFRKSATPAYMWDKVTTLGEPAVGVGRGLLPDDKNRLGQAHLVLQEQQYIAGAQLQGRV